MTDSKTFPKTDWESARPAEVGMDAERLGQVQQWFADALGEGKGRLAIVRSGRVVLEYYHHMSETEKPAIASAAKSIYSNVLGILIAEGGIESADELIDDYIRDDLSHEERIEFEEGYLRTPEGRQRLLFAAALDEYLEIGAPSDAPLVSEPVPEVKPRITWLQQITSTPAWTLAQAAAVLLAVVGAASMLVVNLRLEGRVGQLVSDRAVLEEQIATLRGAQRTVSEAVATARLVPGLLRGPGEVERVMIPESSDLIRFQLDLGIDDYESYRATLHDASGDEFWTQSKLRASEIGETVAVTVTLPSELLPHGDYYFRLSGVTTTGHLELVGRYRRAVLDHQRAGCGAADDDRPQVEGGVDHQECR